MLILSFPSYTENVIRHSATTIERPIVSVGPTAADLVVLLRRAQAELPVEAEPTIDLREVMIDSLDSSDDDLSNIYSREDKMDKIVQSPVGYVSEEDELKLKDSESESDRSVKQDPDGVTSAPRRPLVHFSVACSSGSGSADSRRLTSCRSRAPSTSFGQRSPSATGTRGRTSTSSTGSSAVVRIPVFETRRSWICRRM